MDNNNTTNDDSWFYRVNGGSWTNMNNMNNMNAVGWTWYKGTNNLTLNAGNNTIEIANRESGLKIDRMYLTTSTTTPTGVGNASTNCQ
jgi:hypothetical protein